MNIDEQKKGRSVLKTYFVKNATPTEGEFAQFIDSGLNQRDDGLVKPAGDPLSIEASGDDNSFKKALNFYVKFADPDPVWSIALRPRSDPADANTGRLGFSINDAANNSRLCIDPETGHVGIGTASPRGRLDVTGGDVVWSNSSTLNDDQGGSIELGGNSATRGTGTPYIDFHFTDLLQDFNARIINDADSQLTIQASTLRATGNLTVGGNLVATGDARVGGGLQVGGSELYFTQTDHNHSGFGNERGYAAIENAQDYDALMILGRAGTDKDRKVRLWDYLEVNGELAVTGKVQVGSIPDLEQAIANLNSGLAELSARFQNITGEIQGELVAISTIGGGTKYTPTPERKLTWPVG